jgi:hypothetical protein
MSRFGIDNVRGGSYTTFEIDNNTKEFLKREIYAGMNKCYNCGKVGHYIRYCQQICLFEPDNSPISPKKPIMRDSSTQTELELEPETPTATTENQEILLDKWKDLSKEFIKTTEKTFIKLGNCAINPFKLNMHNSNK